MKVQRFVGPTSRSALHEVKSALGTEAVILSNRPIQGGVEIMAVAPGEMARFAASPARSPAARNDLGLPKPAARHEPLLQKQGVRHEPLLSKPAARHEPLLQKHSAGDDPVPPKPDAEFWNAGLMEEVKSLRALLEDQLGGAIWGGLKGRDPGKARLLRDLVASGFGPRLARQFADHLPAGAGPEQAVKWAEVAIARNLAVSDPEEVIERGGVYALMGPTGVGKTTTTAKLAARCVMRHGSGALALLTTDSYRVGAHEQLRTYAKILSVPMYAVSDADDLRVILHELKGKHLVLIDTIGMSQRDRLVAEQVAMFTGHGAAVRRLLLLSATANAGNLDEVVRAYQGQGLAGAIVTKLDETAAFGGVLDVVLRHKLPLHYVSNGQRVPEDLHPAKREWLSRHVMRAAHELASALTDDDMPAALAGIGGRLAAHAHAA